MTDLWSVACSLAELFTENVLSNNDLLQKCVDSDSVDWAVISFSQVVVMVVDIMILGGRTKIKSIIRTISNASNDHNVVAPSK